MNQTVRNSSRMTFSSLCEFLSATPVRQLSILKAQKYPKGGPIRSYQNALQQIAEFAVNGTALNPQSQSLDTHEQEVINQLITNSWTRPAAMAAQPSTRQSPLLLNGVEISVVPDLLLADNKAANPQTGALKFYFRKTQTLDPNVARWMASFLYQYKVQVEQDASADPDLCLVYDVRNNDYFEAGKSYKQLFKNIEGACQFIGAVWPQL